MAHADWHSDIEALNSDIYLLNQIHTVLHGIRVVHNTRPMGAVIVKEWIPQPDIISNQFD